MRPLAAGWTVTEILVELTASASLVKQSKTKKLWSNKMSGNALPIQCHTLDDLKPCMLSHCHPVSWMKDDSSGTVQLMRSYSQK